MEKKETPSKQEATNGRRSQALFEVKEESERPGEGTSDKADDDDEPSFDIPRD